MEPEIAVVENDEPKLYKENKGATVADSRVIDPFDSNRSWSVEALRGPEGLRRWTNGDLMPRPGDVFQERLYCIRWIDAQGNKRYAAPDASDLAREARVLELLRERFADWQREGFIPSKAIPECGEETDAPIPRARLDPLAPPFHATTVVDAWVSRGGVRTNRIAGRAPCGLPTWTGKNGRLERPSKWMDAS